MTLPFFDKLKKKNPASYFLVLVLRTEKASAVIFEEQMGKVKILGHKEEYFERSIEDASSEEFLDVLDKAISGAENALPQNTETQKTIFGVKEAWTEDNQIKKEYLSKLKRASDELGLTPIGFLVIPQAIAHFLQKEEGAPISGILVDAGSNFVTVTLIRGGKIIESKTSEIHQSIPFTVDALLKHFQVAEILPSRIITFNGAEDLSQEFIGHTFSKSLPFLHLPQITNLPFGFPAKSVLFGAATQMGFEVLDVLERPAKSANETKRPINNEAVFENFGFVKDQDVRESALQREEKKPEGKIEEEGEKIKRPTPFQKITNASSAYIPIIVKNIKAVPFGKLLPSFFAPKSKKILVVFAGLIIILGIFLFYSLGVKATVILNIDPKILEKDKPVSFSKTSPTDTEKNNIFADPVSVSEEGNISTPATGKKDIGTNAKGTVTIFNLSKNTKTLPAGTEISSPNNLKFVLDNSVTLASASSSTDSSFNVTTKPSTVNVNVTADQLGKESNLPSGTKFSVASFETSDLVAKNDNPFSGGTKKEVTVVSKSDIDKLKTTLPKSLEKKAKEDLENQISKDKVLLPVFLDETLKDIAADSPNEEKKQATLKATVLYDGLSYKKDDLNSVALALLQNDIPKNLTLDIRNIKTDVKNVAAEKNKEISAVLIIKALLLPKIEEEKIKQQIKGKSFKDAENQLLKLPRVENVNISASPNLPLFPKRIPSIVKNIQILTRIND